MTFGVSEDRSVYPFSTVRAPNLTRTKREPNDGGSEPNENQTRAERLVVRAPLRGRTPNGGGGQPNVERGHGAKVLPPTVASPRGSVSRHPPDLLDPVCGYRAPALPLFGPGRLATWVAIPALRKRRVAFLLAGGVLS